MTAHVSPAGHQFFYVPMDDAQRTAVAITWASGLPTGPGIHEATARLGIELMLNGGAGGLPPDEISADFEDLDAGSRLWVQPGEIRGFVVAPDDQLDRAAEIANLVLAQPALDNRWLERQKRNLLRDTRIRNATATGLAWSLAREIMLEDHPFKRFWTAAPVDEIQSISAPQIDTWHKGAFGTADLTITAAGTAGPETVARAIDLALAGLPKSANPNPVAFQGPRIRPGTIVLHDPDSPKSLIMTLGELPGAPATDDDIYGIATAVLGLGKQSRLFKAIRSQLRAAYGFGAGMESVARHHRLLRMGGEVDTALLPQALDAMRQSYETFRREGIAREEFPIARNFHLQRIEQNLSRPAGMATMLMENRLNAGSAEDFETLANRIEALERTAVNDTIMANYPPFDEMLTIVITPDATAIADACVITAVDEWRKCY
ncbi:MAG: insulinase family protein [Alphaproteobacteria bacterium]|nr:insulinase family protein [Alphaproteobacteria bacterium]